MKYYWYVFKINIVMDESICDDIEWNLKNIIYCCFDLKLGGWILFIVI